MIPSLPAGEKRFVTRYRVGVSLLLALAAAVMYAGVVWSVDGGGDTTSRGDVTTVAPAAGSVALRQSPIFVRLDSAYTGVLIVDGTEIPEDQLDHRQGLNTVGYTPGPGTETGPLKPGKRCGIVVYWPLAESRASSESFNWCWTVH